MGGFLGRHRTTIQRSESESSSECSTTNSNRTEEEEEANEAGWETIEIIWQATCADLESRNWETSIVIAARKAKEEAEAALKKEEEEARAAEEAAHQEREEYLEAQRTMEKERLEAEEAARAAEEAQRQLEEQEEQAAQELREAEEAEAAFAKEEAEAAAAEEDFERELQEAEEAEELARQMWKAAEVAEQAAVRAMQRVERAILKDEAFADFERAELAALKAKEAAEEQQKRAEKERREAEEAHAVAIRERREAEEARLVAQKERREAEEHAALVAQRRAEAEAAAARAAVERLEYEAALAAMEKEKKEYEEAQRVAEKERREAVQAQRRRDEQSALHSCSVSIAQSCVARTAMKLAIQVVPDDHPSLEDALAAVRSAAVHSREPARIWIRAGRHPVARPFRLRGYGLADENRNDDEEGVDVDAPVDILGEEGAVLTGSVGLAHGGGGILRDVAIESSAAPAVWATGGEWSLVNCHVHCTGAADALLCGGEARLSADTCRIGGAAEDFREQPSTEIILASFMGLAERSTNLNTRGARRTLPRCCVAVQGKGVCNLTGCRLRGAFSAIASLQQSGSLKMTYCEASGAPAAFTISSASPAASLALFHSNLRTPHVWDGIARPGLVEDSSNRVQFFTSSKSGTRIRDGSLTLQS